MVLHATVRGRLLTTILCAALAAPLLSAGPVVSAAKPAPAPAAQPGTQPHTQGASASTVKASAQVALQLLARSLRAEASYSYSGVQVLTRESPMGSDTEVSRLFHRKPDEYRSEVERLGGVGDSITVDDGSSLWSFDERLSNGVSQDESPSAGPRDVVWQKRERLLEANYAVELEGTDKVAGRSTGIMAFYPKWQPRSPGAMPAWRFWVDTDTGLTLRTERYGYDGSVTELRYFAEFTVNPVLADSLFKPQFPRGTPIAKMTRPKLYQTPDQLAEKAGVPFKVPLRLPGGFEFAWGRFRRLDGQVVTELRYTDGLVAMSVAQTFPPSGLRSRLVGLPGGSESLLETTADLADVTILADMPPASLIGFVQGMMAAMGLQYDASQLQPQSRSVQDRLQDRFRTIRKLLGMPPDLGR